jgi:hypothetical protein
MEPTKPIGKRLGRPKGKGTRTAVIRALVTPAVKQWAEDLAYERDISMSQLIAHAIEEKMRRTNGLT